MRYFTQAVVSPFRKGSQPVITKFRWNKYVSRGGKMDSDVPDVLLGTGI